MEAEAKLFASPARTTKPRRMKSSRPPPFPIFGIAVAAPSGRIYSRDLPKAARVKASAASFRALPVEGGHRALPRPAATASNIGRYEYYRARPYRRLHKQCDLGGSFDANRLAALLVREFQHGVSDEARLLAAFTATAL